ncbi:hypothetical protein CONCODRAFT_12349, partial [Conidiobolus coronatus NRRL 28638]
MNKFESLINCNSCKTRKVKCGRELPMCSYCSKRGRLCVYSDQIRRRGVSEAESTSFMSKINVRPKFLCYKLASGDRKKNETQACRFIIFQPILRPIDFVDESSQEIVTKIQFNNPQKFQTHILIILSTQIIDYDRELIPKIDFFVNELELGVFGGLLRFSIHMSQEWIVELLSPSFEEK